MADFCGLVPVVAHYLLLDAPAGAAMSALYMVIDVTAAFEDRSRRIHRLFMLHYVLAAALVALTYQAPFDLLALFGTLSAIVSRQQKQMRHLLLLIAVSCIGWGLYGVFAGSIGQVVFSTIYALFSVLGIRRIAYQTHA